MARGYDFGFVEWLVAHGLVAQDQVDAAARIAENSVEDPDDVLVRMRHLSPEKRISCLSRYLGIPYTDLEIEMVDPEAVKLIPSSMALEFRAFPVKVEDDELTVAVCRPISMETYEMLAFKSGLNVKAMLCDDDDFWRVLKHFYGDEFTQGKGMQLPDSKVVYLDDRVQESMSRVDIVEDEVIDLVDSLVAEGIAKRASDIHLEPNENSTSVRLRIDGVLTRINDIPLYLHEAVLSRIKILSTLDITERRRPQDGVIFVKYKNRDVDLRVATSPTIYGESVTLRLLDQEKAAVALDQLGFTGEDLERTLKSLEEPHGFILSTGPTGSGKTTTMYALINQLDKGDLKIITIENPVEYRIDGICQIPVNKRINLGFTDILKSVLRQDPNVILVGEIRDPETAQTAVQAALTGHLMLSTLHTTSAPEVLLRLMDIGVEYYYVREVVKLIIAQRLCRKLCTRCREERRATEAELEEMRTAGGPDAVIYGPRGCEHCGGIGYIDRTGVYEVMPVTHEIKRHHGAGCPA